MILDGGAALLTTGADGKLRAWDLSDLETPRTALAEAVRTDLP